MLKRKPYKAIIIGAGRIAAGYDNPGSPDILTHAHAYKENSRTELAGFFDVNREKAEQAAKTWSCAAFSSFAEIEEQKPDIISVCTPDSDHFSTLKKIAGLKSKPRIVICEKPATTSLDDTEKIIKLFRRKKIPILVDHTQRFNKGAQAVEEQLKNGFYGKTVFASAVYSKGVLHGGVHVLDTARYFFGEMKSFRALHAVEDCEKPDMTVGAFIEFERCKQFYLIAGDEKNFSFAQMDIVCEKGRFYFPDFWFTLIEQKVVDDPVFRDYKILSKQIPKKIGYGKALLNMTNNAIDHFEKGKPLLSDISDAFKTQKICLTLLNAMKKYA